MSEEKQLSLIPFADFTSKDLEIIDQFKENGMMGLHTLSDIDIERMMGLYMDGKSYRQIANLLKKKRDIILFLSHKLKWYELRKEYLDELHTTLKDKVTESKLQSQEFLLELVLAYQKKIGKNIHQYLRTDDDKFADKVDQKDVGTLLKVMELLHRLNTENLGNINNDKALVGFNGLGQGMTITKTGANSVEIMPTNPSNFSTKLKQFADLKREKEKEQLTPKPIHDITIEEKEDKND